MLKKTAHPVSSFIDFSSQFDSVGYDCEGTPEGIILLVSGHPEFSGLGNNSSIYSGLPGPSLDKD